MKIYVLNTLFFILVKKETQDEIKYTKWEELARLEMVRIIVHQLTGGASLEEIEKARLGATLRWVWNLSKKNLNKKLIQKFK